jgi:hypothetical protein
MINLVSVKKLNTLPINDIKVIKLNTKEEPKVIKLDTK